MSFPTKAPVFSSAYVEIVRVNIESYELSCYSAPLRGNRCASNPNERIEHQCQLGSGRGVGCNFRPIQEEMTQDADVLFSRSRIVL